MAMLITNQTTQDYWFGPLHLPAGVGQTLTVDDTSATSLYLTDDGVADAINTLAASTPTKITVTAAAPPFPRPTGVPTIVHGDGSPEGVVYAGQGSMYLRRDNTGGAQLYQKTTGIHVNTGWVSLAGAITTPTGAMHMYGGAAAPSGWLLCDGSPVSRTIYADLYNVIGSAFGNGDGSTTFNLPDMRGRVPVGYAASGGHGDVSTLGAADTVALANRRPKHKHTLSGTPSLSGTPGLSGTPSLSGAPSISDPGHYHVMDTSNVGGGSYPHFVADAGYNRQAYGPIITDNATTGITAGLGSLVAGVGSLVATIGSLVAGIGSLAAGTSTDQADAPAYLVTNYIIKT